MPGNQVGFIGVGQLARPMVKHLLSEGYHVLIHNRRREAVEELISLGAEYCDRPEEAVVENGILFNCLPDDAAVFSVFHPHGAIFKNMGQKGLHVSMATIAPQTSRIMKERHRTLGGSYCVANVMGRPDAVENKKQIYILGGEPEHLERVRPILESIGSAAFTFGDDPTMANVVKLSLNFLIASAMESMAETFVFARKNGVNVEKLFSMMSESLFACPIYKNYGKTLLEGHFRDPLFRLALGAKDIDLVCRAAKESRSPMRFAGALQDRFTAAMAKGKENYDWTALMLEVEEEAGIKRD